MAADGPGHVRQEVGGGRENSSRSRRGRRHQRNDADARRVPHPGRAGHSRAHHGLLLAAAQEPDGYLYTPRTVDPKNPAPGAGPERWTWLGTRMCASRAGRAARRCRAICMNSRRSAQRRTLPMPLRPTPVR
ncbi:MAG: hypothetical protein DMF91_10225 [Acidobacteria bacterium]|nr:MAG: hypothetical protein DMF91_10225 [Acidobacteriota bacterium]